MLRKNITSVFHLLQQLGVCAIFPTGFKQPRVKVDSCPSQILDVNLPTTCSAANRRVPSPSESTIIAALQGPTKQILKPYYIMNNTMTEHTKGHRHGTGTAAHVPCSVAWVAVKLPLPSKACIHSSGPLLKFLCIKTSSTAQCSPISVPPIKVDKPE
eukprot:860379-Amphidinium_carterae.4